MAVMAPKRRAATNVHSEERRLLEVLKRYQDARGMNCVLPEATTRGTSKSTGWDAAIAGYNQQWQKEKEAEFP